ncbi:MAG TPA: hypothetical protein VIY49_16090 [Bryobacteraceae bacterium]
MSPSIRGRFEQFRGGGLDVTGASREISEGSTFAARFEALGIAADFAPSALVG